MSTANTPIISKNFLLKLSDDNFETTYTVVCLTKQGMTRSRQVNEKDTQCGIMTSRGAAKRVIPFELVVNTTPNAVVTGVGEASYKKLEEWFENDVALQFKRESPVGAGTDLSQTGVCYITRFDDDETVGEYMSASGDLTIEGEIDLTPA